MDKGKSGLPKEPWKQENDHYSRRMSYGSILTRSQTPFTRVKNTGSDMDLFSNGALHHPSSRPHLMVSMVGQYGAIPRTIVTRSAANKLELDKNLLKVIKDYNKLSKTDPLIKELKEKLKENPNLLNPDAAVQEVPEGEILEMEGQSSADEKSGYESSAAETTESESPSSSD